MAGTDPFSPQDCRGTELVHVCGHDVPSGGADLLSHPGARGGLDARLGASRVPQEGEDSQNNRE